MLGSPIVVISFCQYLKPSFHSLQPIRHHNSKFIRGFNLSIYLGVDRAEPLVYPWHYSFQSHICVICLCFEEKSHLMAIKDPFVSCGQTCVPKHHLFAAIRMKNRRGCSFLKVYLVQRLLKEEYVPRSLVWLFSRVGGRVKHRPTCHISQVPIGVAFNRCCWWSQLVTWVDNSGHYYRRSQPIT
jgi:hypothetical protein